MKFTKLFLSFGLPFGIAMGFFHTLGYNLTQGIIVGVLAGALFGFSMAISFRSIRGTINNLRDTVHNTIEKGDIIFEGHVGTFDGFKIARSGWLCLTKEKLVFVTKAKKRSDLLKKEIKLNETSKVEFCKVRLNPNAFCVTNDGKEYKFFIVNHIGANKIVSNSTWVGEIQNAIRNKFGAVSVIPEPSNDTETLILKKGSLEKIEKLKSQNNKIIFWVAAILLAVFVISFIALLIVGDDDPSYNTKAESAFAGSLVCSLFFFIIFAIIFIFSKKSLSKIRKKLCENKVLKEEVSHKNAEIEKIACEKKNLEIENYKLQSMVESHKKQQGRCIKCGSKILTDERKCHMCGKIIR